jgi:hypothetical protein
MFAAARDATFFIAARIIKEAPSLLVTLPRDGPHVAPLK